MSHAIRRYVRDRLVRAVREAVRAELEEQQQERDDLHERTAAAVGLIERRLRHDVGLAMDNASVRASAELVLREMSGAQPQVAPHETLRFALESAPPTGMITEFGVATGATLRLLAEQRGERPVYGFDSFSGLPESWRPGFDSSSFAQPQVPDVPGAELVLGYFSDTLPGFFEQHSGTIALLHCDADLYTSTRTVLEHAGPRLRAGSVVLFDEYFNYPWWQEHEHRAWLEWTAEHGVGFEYTAFTWEHQQVAVRVLRTPWDGAG